MDGRRFAVETVLTFWDKAIDVVRCECGRCGYVVRNRWEPFEIVSKEGVMSQLEGLLEKLRRDYEGAYGERRRRIAEIIEDVENAIDRLREPKYPL